MIARTSAWRYAESLMQVVQVDWIETTSRAAVQEDLPKGETCPPSTRTFCHLPLSLHFFGRLVESSSRRGERGGRGGMESTLLNPGTPLLIHLAQRRAAESGQQSAVAPKRVSEGEHWDSALVRVALSHSVSQTQALHHCTRPMRSSPRLGHGTRASLRRASEKRSRWALEQSSARAVGPTSRFSPRSKASKASRSEPERGALVEVYQEKEKRGELVY